MARTPLQSLLSLRGRVLVAHAIGLLLITAAGLAGIAFLDLSILYVQKAVGVFAIVAVITLATVDDHHPFPAFGPANYVTTVRAALTALVAGLLGEVATPAVGLSAALTSLVITALDGVDGWLARRTGMTSAFGARYDMETDALLILALSLLSWQFGQAGSWIVVAGLLRYIFIVAGWLAAPMRAPLLPSWRRQAVCVVQILGLSVVASLLVAPPLSTGIAVALVALLVYSFAVDTLWLVQRTP